MGNCSSTSNCNPCGPDYAAINQLATKTGAYARQAKTYATDAENAWLEFNALYLGAFADEPMVDNEGDPLQVGALYWNTGDNELYVWNGTSWTITNDFNEFTAFLATGTTTPRNLVTRFSDTINIMDFGAVGDGIANDTVAVQNAVAYAFTNNKSIHLTNRFNITATTNIPNIWNVKYFGEGVFIVGANSLNPNKVKSNFTLTIGPGVADFPDLNTALDAIGNWSIDNDATLTLSIAEGDHTSSQTTFIYHPYANRILITGATPIFLTFSSLVSISSLGVGNHDVTFQFASTTGVVAGRYINIRGLAGTGGYKTLEGCWEITNVSGNNITVRNTCRLATIPASTVTSGQFAAFRTVLKYDNCSGWSINTNLGDGDRRTAGARNLCIVGINQVLTQLRGVFVDYNCSATLIGGMSLTQAFGINGFSDDGLFSIFGGTINASDICVSNCQSNGIFIIDGGIAQIVRGVATGNDGYGIVSSAWTHISATGCNSSGNLNGALVSRSSLFVSTNGFFNNNVTYGIRIEKLSIAEILGIDILNNGDYGIYATLLSYALLNDSGSIVTGNTTSDVYYDYGSLADIGVATVGVTEGTQLGVQKTYSASIAHDFTSSTPIPANSEVSVNITINGVLNSPDFVTSLGFNGAVTPGVVFYARCTGTNQATIFALNVTTSPISVGLRTYRVLVQEIP
jgi:hypothetical protein